MLYRPFFISLLGGIQLIPYFYRLFPLSLHSQPEAGLFPSIGAAGVYRFIHQQ